MKRTYTISTARLAATIKRRLRDVALTVLVGVVVLIAQACGKNAAAETPLPAAVATIVEQDVATVERAEIADGPMITGTLTARRHATIRAEVAGVITAALVDRGMPVSAGTPLLRIDDRALRDAQAAARTEAQTDDDAVTLAQRRLARSEKLLAGGAISAEEVEDARQTLQSAESRLAGSRARLTAASDALAHTVVRAPFGGVVSARPVNGGDIVQSGDVLFEVIDPTTMYLETSIPSAQLGAIHVGSPVSFTVGAYRDRTFTGRIERVNPAADPTTRQVPVFVSIDNGDGRLVAGLFAEGRIAPVSGPTLIVPGAAIDRSGTAPTVVRLARGYIERKPVELGRQDRDGAVVEVRSGLTLGDTVLLGVARSLPTGTPARVADTKIARPPIAR